MKNFMFLFLAGITLLILSCTKDELEESETSYVTEASNYLEAASILSNYNLNPDAQINIILTNGMNSIVSYNKGIQVHIASIFGADFGPTISGDLHIEPFGEIEVGGSLNDAYFLNAGYSDPNGQNLTSQDYTITYNANSTDYNDIQKDVFMDMNFLVDNSFDRIEAKYYLDKTIPLTFEWEPLLDNDSDLFIGFCPDQVKCFYAKIEDNGFYELDPALYSNLPSGQSLLVLMARGYQECFTNTGKEVCITNFAVAQNVAIVK